LPPIDFNVTILTIGHWPVARMQDTVQLPEMQALQQRFSKWYVEKFSNRVLKWVLSLGEVSVKMTMPDGKSYDIAMLPLQAVILRLFDELAAAESPLSLADVHAKSGIAELDVVKRVLHSLCCQKYKLLLKSTESKNIGPRDAFRANAAFVNSTKRFRVAMATLDDGGGHGGTASDAAQAAVRKTMLEDRGFLIDSIVVRIMKARKRLSHAELLGEIVHQVTTFQPDPAMVKTRVGSLIERDFLERAEDDSKSYVYVP
jgi:hypothetical protein